jgi:hypothetical protein
VSLASCGVRCPNSDYLFIGKSRLRVGDSAAAQLGVKASAAGVTDCLPALRDHIGRVGKLVTQKEMRRIDAISHVTRVADELPVWNYAVFEHERHTVSSSNAVRIDADQSVSTAVETASPQPAVVSFQNATIQARAKIGMHSPHSDTPQYVSTSIVQGRSTR